MAGCHLPIGCGVLGLVFTLKLIEISQRMDGSQSLPGVKEVVFLLVFFAVFLFLIQNSFDLMASIYEVCGLAIDRVEALFGAGGALDLPEVSVVTTDDDIPSLIAMLVVSSSAGSWCWRPTSSPSWSAGPARSSSTSWPRSPRSAGVPRHGRHAPDRPWLP